MDERQTTNLQLQLYRNEMLERSPKLVKLDTLELEFEYYSFSGYWVYNTITYSPYLEETLGDIMIKPYYQSQLKTLQLDGANNLLKFKLCNVKELSLVHLQCDLKELKFQGPVEKLTLLKPHSNISFVNIFNKFPTLKYLRIDKKVLTTCLTESNLSENENNVHTLEILDLNCQDYIPYNLGFMLPKLRYLVLRSYENKYIEDGAQSYLDLKYDQSFTKRRVKIAHLICGGTSYDSTIWNILPQLEILTFQFQDHMYDFKQCRECDDDLTHKHCECKFLKGTKYECPFKN